jgi:phage tail-like protein
MTSQGDDLNFLILNTRSDWARGLSVGLQTADSGLMLVPLTAYTTERTIDLQGPVAGRDMRDMAVYQCQLIYLLETAAPVVWILDPLQGRFERMTHLDAVWVRPTALAALPGTLFVADAEAEQRLYALAPLSGQIRWTVGPTQDAAGQPLGLNSPFTPVELAVDDNANVYAFDRVNHVIVHFNRAGAMVQLLGGEALAESESVRIAASPDGVLYALDPQAGNVWRFTADSRDAFIDLQTLPFAITPSDLTVDRHGQLYLGDGRTLPEDEEDDRFLRRFSAAGDLAGEVQAYRGSVARLDADTRNRLVIFNREAAQIIILQLQQTLVPPGSTPPPEGYYFSKALDSTELGTQWHKLVLQAETPDNTQVRVSYLSADEKAFTAQGINDLDVFLADAERTPAEKVERLQMLEWSTPVVNPHDALIRSSVGRYLWLRLQLIGSEQDTPTVESLRVDFPRLSYLRYLPAVYQEDERSRDFLERFLSLFEGFFTQIEGQIAHIVRYFDADAVDGDFLRWLASWLAITVDEHWSETQLREIVRRAPELYMQRGTRAGIEAMVALFTGETPFIVEHFQLQCAQSPQVKRVFEQLYGVDPYCFCVLLKPSQVSSDAVRQTLERLLDADKPAHTCAGLVALQPWIYLDLHTYLGVNTYLSTPSPRLDVGSIMPRDTVLSDIPEAL